MSVNFFGFFFERFRFRCFQGFCRWCALGHAFCNYAQFCCWCVCSSRVGVAALLAFPDAYALPSHSWKAACWASVAFLQFNHYFDVAFSYSGPVADAQPACRSHLFGSSQSVFHQSSCLRSSLALSLAIFAASNTCFGSKNPFSPF